MLTAKINWIGRHTLDLLAGLGEFVIFSWQTITWIPRGANRWMRPTIIMPQLYSIGTQSAPVIMLLGAFVGMVLSIEGFDQFAAIGQEGRLGGVINISVVKQIGPVLAAVMLAGRVGGSVSAELGTMRVTEQLDALRVMGADPFAYLVVPRVLACIVMIPVLTIFSDLMGILGGYFITVRGFGVSSTEYWEFSAQFIGTYDVMTGLVKSVVFGMWIGLISCYKGFNCRSGAAGVGRAATDAFVTSFVAIIVTNFFLAKFLKDLWGVLYGQAGINALG